MKSYLVSNDNGEGVPATVLHASSDNRAESVIVAETVQAFITAMDALRLQQRAVDEVQVRFTEPSQSTQSSFAVYKL